MHQRIWSQRIFNCARWLQSSVTMASTEKLKTRAVIKFSQQQGDNSPKTLKENAAAHGKHAVSRTLYFDWHTFVHVLEKESQALTTSKEEGERRKLHRR